VILSLSYFIMRKDNNLTSAVSSKLNEFGLKAKINSIHIANVL